MRRLNRILGTIVAIIFVIAIIGLFFPREIEVARTVTIDAPADKIFPHINNLEKTIAWSPWLERDPEVVNTFSGAAEGVGAIMTWASDDPGVGKGTMEIVNSEPSRRLDVALDFDGHGKADAFYDLAEGTKSTSVTWGVKMDMGWSPVGRYFGLLMDGWIGADYEKGLTNLKELVETES